MLEGKTGKREIAWLLTGVLCWTILGTNVPMVEAIIWPILSYVAAASGLHIYQMSTRTTNVTRKEE